MRVFSFLISALAHVAILLAAIAGLPSFYENGDDYVMIPVEILEIGDETNVRAAAMELADEPEPPKPQEQEEPRYAEAPPPPPPMSEPVPQDAMPPLPTDNMPKAKPVETKKINKKSMPRRKPSPPKKNNKNDDLDLTNLKPCSTRPQKKSPNPERFSLPMRSIRLMIFLPRIPATCRARQLALGPA